MVIIVIGQKLSKKKLHLFFKLYLSDFCIDQCNVENHFLLTVKEIYIRMFKIYISISHPYLSICTHQSMDIKYR